MRMPGTSGGPLLTAEHNGDVSFWWRARGGFPPRRPSLPGSLTADVCIVGGGYTGLWTAYYLKQAEPALRIVVLEAAFAGFGASGRNGGWLTSALPGSRERYARGPGGRDAVLDLQRQLRETVDEVARVCEAEGIDADLVKGGELAVATTPAQLGRPRTRSCWPTASGGWAKKRSSSWARPSWPPGSASPEGWARCTRRTAPGSSRPSWSPAWPTRSSAAGWRSTKPPR